MILSSFRFIIAASIVLQISYSLHPITTSCSNNRRTRLYLRDGESNSDNFRVVNPSNIASLFEKSEQSRSTKLERSEKDDATSDEEEYDDSIYDVDDEDEMEDLLISSKNSMESINSKEKIDTLDESSPVMQELRAVQSLEFSSPNSASERDSSASRVNMKERRVVDELEAQYVDLDQSLDQTISPAVVDSITVSEPYESRAALDRSQQRIFSYDPSPTAGRDDPMKWGAYRIHQKNVPDDTESNPNMPKRRPTKGENKKSSKKDDNRSDTNSFYNAIKNLGGGSGGEADGGPLRGGPQFGVGLAEPSGDKKPITPRKASANRRKKTIITPSDINSLFDSNNVEKNEIQQNSIEEDEDDDQSSTGTMGFMGMGKQMISNDEPVGKFNPVIEPGEEIPKWLEDARQERKKEIQNKRNKKKMNKLTRDWRFWLACIAGAGFVTAFINVYQQTGGFGSTPGGGIPGGEMLI